MTEWVSVVRLISLSTFIFCKFLLFNSFRSDRWACICHRRPRSSPGRKTGGSPHTLGANPRRDLQGCLKKPRQHSRASKEPVQRHFKNMPMSQEQMQKLTGLRQCKPDHAITFLKTFHPRCSRHFRLPDYSRRFFPGLFF